MTSHPNTCKRNPLIRESTDEPDASRRPDSWAIGKAVIN
jgi:hypothetical protein